MPLQSYPFFPGFTNSPSTYLTAGITATDTTIPVNDLAMFPAAPNVAVIGTGTDAETIYYSAKSASTGAGNLTSVTRAYAYTGVYGVAKAWLINEKIGRNYTSYDHASLLANVTPIVPSGGDVRNISLTKDNNGIERKFWKADFSNNTIADFTLSGSAASIAAGIMSVPATGVAYHTLPSTCTAGKWDGVVEFTASGAGTEKLLLGDAGTSYVIVTRIVTTNQIWLQLYIGGVSKVANTDTGVTLADNTFANVSAVYDGTSWQMYWAGVAVGANTAAITVTTPIIGCAAGTIAGAWNELTFIPSVAFTDPFTSDTETRYMQLSSTDLSAWAASAAGDVVVTGGKMTLAGTTPRGIYAIGRSYMYASGEIEISFDCNNDGGGGADATGAVFCYQDILNHYKLVLEDSDGAGTAETLKLYKVVAGTPTQLGSTATITARYAKGTRCYAKIQFSRETGQMWVYFKDNTGASSGLYPTTPDIADAFSTQFPYGKAGYFATVTTAGAGNLNVDFYPMTIRAALLIGETNIPTKETGMYFMPSGIGQFSQTGTWTFTGTTLTCSSAGNAILPFQTTIGVHRFTPTLANGTDYFYFGGYRIKFVASGGNQCLVTLETTAGVAQGTGSLTITTTAGLFANPIIITETESAITVTVTGSGGTPIVSGTTTSTNAYPKFTVGTATCTFADYSFSGTRYYMRPMLRGAQIGAYWDGTKEVACTRFCDDFNWDTSLEYTQGGTATLTYDTANGHLTISGATNGRRAATINSLNLYSTLNGTYEFEIMPNPTGGGTTNKVNTMYIGNDSFNGNYGVRVVANIAASTLSVAYGDGSAFTAIGTSYSQTWAADTWYTVTLTISGTTVTTKLNGVDISVLSGTSLATVTASRIIAVATYSEAVASVVRVRRISINALESTSTNGIAVCPASVPHGGRYDIQEECYFTWTNATQNGDALVQSRAKSTYPTTASFEYYFINSTDSTAINWDGQSTAHLTPGTTYLDGVARALLRYQDVGDTIKISIRRKDYSGITYDNQPAVYTDLLAFVPVWGV